MSEQGPGLLLTPKPPVDGGLFNVYELLDSDDSRVSDRILPSKAHLEAQREAFFLSGATALPDLIPDSLDPSVLDEEEDVLLGFKADLAEMSEPSDIRRLYRWRINERIANVRISRASFYGDMTEFDRYNHFIYGSPDKQLFGAVADSFAFEAEQNRDSTYEIHPYIDTVLEALEDYRTNRDLLEPDPAVFEEVRRLHFQRNGYYPLLLAGVEIPETARIDQDTGNPIAAQVISNLDSDYVLAPVSGTSWSLDHAEEQVRHPDKYNMIRRRFIGLSLGHEIGQHLGERMNGLRGAIRLSADGFDRYETASEGHATIREQVMYGSFPEFASTQRWQIIRRRYLSTALALGMAGNKEFPDVFKVVNAVDNVYEIGNDPDHADNATAKARKRSWQLLSESIYKGTDGTLPYRRYGIYLPGNVAYWELAKRDPGLVAGMGIGKLDLTNARHELPVEKYGMLPKVDA